MALQLQLDFRSPIQGFRMSAHCRGIHAHGGRRPEASGEGTRESVCTLRCRTLWGFGGRGGYSGRCAAPRLDLIELAGRHNG